MATGFKAMRGIGLRRKIEQRLSEDTNALTRSTGVRVSSVGKFFGYGVPGADGDLASRDGDLCYDGTNDDVYVASNVTDDGESETTTWTKISG